MFKNVIAFQMPDDFPEVNVEQIKSNQFVKCSGLESSKMGFISCLLPESGEDSLLYSPKMGHFLLKIKKEEKILPSSVVNEFLKEKIERQESFLARKLKKSEKESLKDEVLMDLLPQAFSKYKYNYLWLDYQNKLLYIDASSYKQAEDIISLLRKSVGTLNLKVLDVDLPLLMTKWLKTKQAPQKFTYLDKVSLEDNVAGSKIIVSKEDLDSSEIQNHLDSGKIVSNLSLEYNQLMTFTLKGDGSLSQIKINNLKTELEEENETPEEKFKADLFLSTSNITQLLLDLYTVLKQEN